MDLRGLLLRRGSREGKGREGKGREMGKREVGGRGSDGREGKKCNLTSEWKWSKVIN